MQKYQILYDDNCGLCGKIMEIISRLDRNNKFSFISIYSDEAKSILKKCEISPDFDSVIVISEMNIYTKSDAVFLILGELPFPVKILMIFKLLPPRLRDKIYSILAANRFIVSCKLVKGRAGLLRNHL